MKSIFWGMARFGLLTLAMFAHVALLALVEAALLWSLEIGPFGASSRLTVSVVEFSISHDGRWGASLIRISRSACLEGFQSDILLHDLHDSARFVRLNVGELAPHAASISPAGDAVAILGDAAVFVWRRGAGLQRFTPVPGARPWRVLWSQDSQRIAVFDDRHFYLWDVSSGKFQGALELEAHGAATWEAHGDWSVRLQHDQPLHVAVSPKDGGVAFTRYERMRQIELDHSDGGSRDSLVGHEAPICGLAFAGDGVLYSWDHHGVILGWNTRSRGPVWRFVGAQQAPLLEGGGESLANPCKIPSGRL